MSSDGMNSRGFTILGRDGARGCLRMMHTYRIPLGTSQYVHAHPRVTHYLKIAYALAPTALASAALLRMSTILVLP